MLRSIWKPIRMFVWKKYLFEANESILINEIYLIKMFRGQGFIRQGTGQFAHTGNQPFRKMIIGEYDEHSNIQRKTKKTGFVRIIVDEMRYDGIWLLNKIKTIG